MDSLTPVCNSSAPVFSSLGYCIPIAQPVTSDSTGKYYNIGIVDYTQQMHSQLYDQNSNDLHPTKLRGYVDQNPNAQPTYTTDGGVTSSVAPSYLGPIIVAQHDTPAIVTYENLLTAPFFLPVDTTYMGLTVMGMAQSPNRTAVHLHGGFTPWISDGTPFQWFTASGDTMQPNVRGPSYVQVPGMSDPGAGKWTAYYTNDQSARFMFYHDHAVGTTRLNVYAGMAAGYLITDSQEQSLYGTVLPNNAANNGGLGIPLIIQDKTFVPSSGDITANDPSWNDNPDWGTQGDLWLAHVYKANQDDSGTPDPKGRWDNGKWVYPPVQDPLPKPSISGVAEANMDTPVVNGVAYPYLQVAPRRYRFRILNAANDRHVNLQLYYEGNTPITTSPLPSGQTYVGDADLTRPGPPILQIGNEGGFLPVPVEMNNPPTQWGGVPTSTTMPTPYTLWMAPAERADIVIDFSNIPTGTRLILYNDAPSPAPMGDPRLDYYTGDLDQTASGGAPATLPGKGPNTRTIMEFRVVGTGGETIDYPTFVTDMTNALATIYPATQPPAIVPPGTFVSTRDTKVGGYANQIKSLNEDFDDYGRLKQNLGTFAQHLNNQGINVSGFAYVDPPTEIATKGQTQVWTIANNTGDVHPIHFHLVNVQVVARTDWANNPVPVDPNELGWKETVRMLPGTNTTVAMKFSLPTVPFITPSSIRLLDPTMAESSVNRWHNFGSEYVWHCHMLEHEEHDMMRVIEVYQTSISPENFLLLQQ
ncbi:multicopper oxidase family protein [Desulfovibrio sp. TomC]|uniref:multicopper oxidase family protein n=1 Tax=Desulfovibrio sp. TomC TaxID=1562888 RepID=UPI0018CED2D5|nr:multicopper oxidase domain-containing protein [Desulfovibrio sp. TomC]